MAGAGRAKNVAVSLIGKIKTASHMTAILLLLYYEPIKGISTQVIGTWLIYLAAVMTVVSMVYYVVQAYKSTRKPRN